MKPKHVLILTDDPRPSQKQHNYNLALRWLVAHGKLEIEPGTLADLTIAHDDWCEVFDGHLCNCRPDLTLAGKRLRYPAKALKG